MMNFARHIMHSSICLVGIGSILGAGFCGWFFYPDEGIKTNELKVAINIANKCDVGTFSYGDDDKQRPEFMILDEGSYGTFDLFDGLIFYRNTEVEINDETNGPIKGNIITENDDLVIKYLLPTDHQKYVDSGLELNLGINFKLRDFNYDKNAVGNIGTENIGSNNNFTKYVSLVDDVTQNTSLINGTDYFVYNLAPRSITNNLNIYNYRPNNMSVEHTYQFNMSSLFKYTDFAHKPTDLEKYSNLQYAMKNRIWVIDIQIMSFYI